MFEAWLLAYLLVQAYFTFMKDVALLLGAEKNQTEKQMLEVLQFEIKLAKLYPSLTHWI